MKLWGDPRARLFEVDFRIFRIAPSLTTDHVLQGRDGPWHRLWIYLLSQKLFIIECIPHDVVCTGNHATMGVWRPEDGVPQCAFPFGISTGTAVLAWVAKFALSVSKCHYH